MLHEKILKIEDSVLLIVDVQEAFRDAIWNFSELASSIARIVQGFAALGLPIVVTEQYPKGLGPTAEEIRLSLPEGVVQFEKTTFSSYGAAAVCDKLKELRRRQVVLCGVETHVCINQTAHDLLQNGYSVHLLTDCVGSRFDHDKLAGLNKMSASGVAASTVEIALFELMSDSRHPKFKEIQALIR